MMRTITTKELQKELRSQGVSSLDLAFICPMCGTVQSARDLINAKAGNTFDEVEKYLGFSCIGRFTSTGPHIKNTPPGKGCNWTLGGLFQIHKLEIIDDEAMLNPLFELATPEQAKEHAEAIK